MADMEKTEVKNDQRDRDRIKRGERPSKYSGGNKDRSRDRKNKDMNRIYVSNIPYDYKWTDVKDLFREKIGDVSYVELFNDENDKPRGCGIVEFSNNESVAKAMEVMHRFPIQGRKLVIKEDYGKERDKFGHVKGSIENSDRVPDSRLNRGNTTRMTDNIDQCNTYGLSANFLESIGVQGPLHNKIFVANLAYKVDKKKLKEVFKMAGTIRNIDLNTDKDGNSRGFATIEYDHPVEAVQAISMFDHQFLFDRKMTVRMDRVMEKAEIRLPEGLKNIGAGLGPNGEPLHDVARSIMQNLPNHQTTTGAGLLGTVPPINTGLVNPGIASGFGNNMQFGLSGMANMQNQFLNQGMMKNDLGSVASMSQSSLGLRGNVLDVGNGSQLQNGMMGNGSMAFNRSGLSSQNTSNFQNLSMMNRQQVSSNNYSTMSMGQISPMSRNSFQNHNMPSDMLNDQQKPMDMIHISNLPSSMTWQTIREKFGEVGDIQFAEKIGSDTAVVRFQSEWGAARAIKMFDRTRIDGRTIEVRYY